MALNQFDQAVETQLDLFRASAGIETSVLAILRSLEKELIGRLAADDLTVWGKTRLEQQLKEVRAIISDRFALVKDTALQSTSAIAEVAALAAGKTLAVGGTEALLPTAEYLRALAGKSVVQGAAQGAWWDRQAADVTWKFAQAVRQGLTNAETNQQIIRRVRGFLDTTRANAAALVQTSVATVANDAREIVFAQNADIIKRYRAVATLDTHTCERCAPLDGLEWKPDGSAIDHGFSKPAYPLHFNCRCLFIPVVFDAPQGGMRASRDGPVSARLTFEGWLERQPKERVEEVLGKGRAELFKAGKITLADLTNGYGRPLSLDQLRKKYA